MAVRKTKKKTHRKLMLINVLESEESRIAVLENDVLEELYVERTTQDQIVGNVYKARVVNIEPSIEAAFVDFGYSRNGFLHVSDVKANIARKKSKEGGSGDRHRRRISELLYKNQEIVVQVTKEGVGSKGPAVTTYLSLPGRYLVLMPDFSRIGVSRRIQDEKVRQKLKHCIEEIKPPEGLGFIVRTAGAAESKREMKRDMDYLMRLWSSMQRRAESVKAPANVYRESDLVIRAIRDLFTTDIGQILVDAEDVHKRAMDFLSMVMPQYKKRLHRYEEAQPLFHRYKIEEEIDKIHSREVALPSGGSIVIDQTEALVAVDVNSGHYTDEADAEETAYRTNLEAAPEIARQLRLRDLGGVIVNDFIDMRDDSHQRDVEKTLWDALRRDRARTKMLRMSKFGTIEMTRQRMRPSLVQATHQRCPYCNGRAFIKSPETVALDVVRRLRAASSRKAVVQVDVAVHPNVASRLFNRHRQSISALEKSSKVKVRVSVKADARIEDASLTVHKSGGGKETV